jgi:peptide chain release factor 1
VSMEEHLEKLVSRFDELTHLMSENNVSGEDYASLSKEYSDLAPIVAAINKFRDARQEFIDAAAMVNDPGNDAEMRELADDECRALKERLVELEDALNLLMVPKDEADGRNAILEIRAGTGGEEAALFAASLFRMYHRYADRMGWKFNVISLQETGIGGTKEAIAEITGRDVFQYLKFESGVHRVQRVPVTESGGRIHTSAATVAVMPEAEEVDVHIEDKDLRIDTFRAQGAGGQHVNTTDSAVRITHIPSGMVVSQQDEKSQHKNKAAAMKILRARLYDAERDRQMRDRAQQRKDQVGSGDRSERIRTYNFPERRVTDHRIGLTLHNLDHFIEGDMDDVINALLAEDNARRLATMK